MKKTLAILLALVMMLATCTAAMADTLTHTLTITDAHGGNYTIYKLATLNAANIYTAAAHWADFFKEGGAGAALVTNVDGNGVLTTKEGLAEEADAALAKAALAYAENTEGISGTTVEAENGSVAFTDLEPGYYLVDSPAGTLDILYSVKGDLTAKEKHEDLPGLVKTVEGGSEPDVNSANVGDTVTFKATITVEAGGTKYVMHDKMDAGLTYTGVTSVTGGNITSDDYNVLSENLCQDCDFHIVFDDAYIAGLTSKTEIVITYTATLNENAVVAGNGNKNSAWLAFGDSVTVPSETTTYTGKIVIDKYDGGYTDAEGKADMTHKLAGAKFKLTKDGDQIGEVLTTDANGAITISGIADGVYTLEETEAPAGYNKLAKAMTIEIVNGEIVKVDTADIAKENRDNTVHVANNTGSSLPSTGGIGTTIFYVVGGLMMAAAVVLLVTKKKTSGNR